MIRTKIVATMGPACGDVDTLLRLFEAGVDVCRLNFSHGALDGHLLTLRNIREAASRHTAPIAILGDLGGPKIRLGQIKDTNAAGGMPIHVGDTLIIQREPMLGENGRVSSTYPDMIDEVCVGQRVLIEDGLLRFVCTDKTANELICSCTAGGILKNSKGINLPDTTVNVPSITERDWECIDWAIEQRLDYLALSFVRKADDIRELRDYLSSKVSDIHLIAKIEKAEAVDHIDEIIDVADGLMVARGDLGVEMDVAEVPIIQKDLIRRCQSAGKPVIVATQMLQSMVEQSSPTRAEVSDVANAIFDGTDAVMLSGETSVGKFPVVTVHTMSHIADVTETYLAKVDASEVAPPLVKTTLPAGALARGTLRVVHDLKAKLVVVWTQTGTTARVFSKHHFPVPIIALSPDHRTLRRMALHYGVIPQEMQATPDLTNLIARIDEFIISRQYAEPKDRVIIVAGWSPGTPGTMNGLVIHTVGESWTPVPTAQMLRQMVKTEKE
ncbi:MAG TPA: pyruvate kinase [Tepidisphaeraceae bacterium]|nr:pyruvate kinase [Tepidisphaeraceae bacterium]